MSKALFVMIAAGIAIGLAWPTGAPQSEAEAAPASGERRETTLEREGNGHFYTYANVNGEPIRFVVDTGASFVALTTKDAKRIGIPFSPAEFEIIGEGASGMVRGKLVELDSVEIDGKRVTKVKAAILEGSRLSLLGQSYLSRMGEVQMRGDYMVLR
jgi:aspartyl protease family protein